MFYLIHFSDHIKIKYKIKSYKRILIKAFKYHYKSAIDYIHFFTCVSTQYVFVFKTYYKSQLCRKI